MTAHDHIEPVEALLQILSDGEWHSGTALARALGVTRSAISARIARLRARDIDIYSVSGKGYRLPAAFDWLSAETIRGHLGARAAAMLDALAIYQCTDSTNSRAAAFDDGLTRACLAEQQTAGRGRAGRRWVSPMASNLYLSVAYAMPAGPAPLGALSLAVGVQLAEMLHACGVADVALKWPNDLWIGRAKVGGILIEARGEAAGHTRLVVGLGLNFGMSDKDAQPIDQAWTRLADHMPTRLSRSRIAAHCLEAVLIALADFARGGFAVFRPRWACFDATAGRAVTLVQGDSQVQGTARGVAADGSLLMEIDGEPRAVYAGDISLRLS